MGEKEKEVVDVLASAMKLNEAQRRHLGELHAMAQRYGDCGWQPVNSGEWAVARALERKRLVLREPSQGRRAYSFTLAQFNKIAAEWPVEEAVQ